MKFRCRVGQEAQFAQLCSEAPQFLTRPLPKSLREPLINSFSWGRAASFLEEVCRWHRLFDPSSIYSGRGPVTKDFLTALTLLSTEQQGPVVGPPITLEIT